MSGSVACTAANDAALLVTRSHAAEQETEIRVDPLPTLLTLFTSCDPTIIIYTLSTQYLLSIYTLSTAQAGPGRVPVRHVVPRQLSVQRAAAARRHGHRVRGPHSAAGADK